MSSVTNCQILSCANAQFTYCPHCSLYICIKCLNEHYSLMKNDYKQNILNFKNELNTNYYNNIIQQKEILEKLYDNEIMEYYEYENFLLDKIDQNGMPITRNFQTHQYLELKEKYSLFMQNRQQFNQLLSQINQVIFDFQQTRDAPRNSSDIIDIEDEDLQPTIKTTSPVTIKLDDEPSLEPSSIGTLESFIEERMSNVTTTSNAAIQSVYYDYDDHPSTKLDTKYTYTTTELRSLHLCCPFTRHTFGLQDHHCRSKGLTNIPCRSSSTKKYLLYSHLTRYHLIQNKLSLKIIRALIYLPNELDKIDLFSNPIADSTNRQTLTSYSNHCPLTKLGVYGILSQHQIKLCDKNSTKKCILFYHFQNNHNLSDRYSAQLVHATMDNIDKNISIIKPNERILCEE